MIRRFLVCIEAKCIQYGSDFFINDAIYYLKIGSFCSFVEKVSKNSYYGEM